MIWIILISILLFIAIIMLFVSVVKLIFSILDISKKKLKSSIVMLIASVLIIVFLGVLDALVIVSTAYKNRDKLVEFTLDTIDSSLRGATAIVSRTLRYTADELINNWDDEYLKQVSNIDLEIKKFGIKKEDAVKVYSFELIFDNKNPQKNKVLYSTLFNSDYLLAGDDDGVLYSFLNYDDSYEYDFIPRGRTLCKVKVKVEPQINLKFVMLGQKRVKMKIED